MVKMMMMVVVMVMVMVMVMVLVVVVVIVTGNPAPVYEVLRKVGAIIPDSCFPARTRMTRVQEQVGLSVFNTQRSEHPRTFVIV